MDDNGGGVRVPKMVIRRPPVQQTSLLGKRGKSDSNAPNAKRPRLGDTSTRNLYQAVLAWNSDRVREILSDKAGSININMLLTPHGEEVTVPDPEAKTFETCLHRAASTGDAATVALLLDANARVDVTDSDGSLPLDCAAYYGSIDCVQLLLEHGAHVNARNYHMATALHAAVNGGSTEVVRLFLEFYSADPDVQDADGCTPLHWSGQNVLNDDSWFLDQDDLECAKLLLTHQADVNKPDNNGDSFLHWVTGQRCVDGLDMLRLLVANDADVHLQNSRKQTPVQLSEESASVERNTLCRPFLYTFTLHEAVGRGNPAETLRLLQAQADPNWCNPRDKQRTSVHLACEKGHADVLKLLKEYGGRIDVTDDTGVPPIHVAASAGALRCVQLLVEAGADIRSTNDNGETCLFAAAGDGCHDVVKYLIGLDESEDFINHKAKSGWTALDFAAEKGALECLLALIQAKADVNSQDDKGVTPLQWACHNGHHEAVTLLINEGAEVNLVNSYGNSALHVAVHRNHLQCVKTLLGLGANERLENNDRLPPIHFAENVPLLQRLFQPQVVNAFHERMRTSRTLLRGDDYTPGALNHTPVIDDISCGTEPVPVSCVNAVDNVRLEESFDYKNCYRRSALDKMSKGHKTPQLLDPSLMAGCFCESGCRSAAAAVTSSTDYNDKKGATASDDEEEARSPRRGGGRRGKRGVRQTEKASPTREHPTADQVPGSPVKIPMKHEGHMHGCMCAQTLHNLYECNEKCRCAADPSSCKNRLVQNGIRHRMQVFRTRDRGWGLRTLEKIPKGEFVLEYVGELTDEAEADRRRDDTYAMNFVKGLVIDAKKYGNLARFCNTSCMPNLTGHEIHVADTLDGTTEERIPRVTYFSTRTIQAGEELFIDYAYKVGSVAGRCMLCTCGTDKCRKKLL